MDFEKAFSIAGPPLLLVIYPASWAALLWGCAWAWWWAVSAAIPIAVGLACLLCASIASVFQAVEWRETWRDHRAYEAARRYTTASPGSDEGGQFQQLKRAVAKILHPDLCRSMPARERVI